MCSFGCRVIATQSIYMNTRYMVLISYSYHFDFAFSNFHLLCPALDDDNNNNVCSDAPCSFTQDKMIIDWSSTQVVPPLHHTLGPS